MELNEFGNKLKNLMGLNENKKKVNGFGCVMLCVDFPDFKKIQSKIDKDDLYVDPNDDSYGMEKESHVTLLYGLHKEVTDDTVEDSVKNIQITGDLRMHDASLFKNEKFEVLKFNVGYATRGGAFLNKANNNLKKLPHTSDFPEFTPHCTIAYLKPNMGDKYVKLFSTEEYVVKPTKVLYSKIDGSEKIIK